MRLNKVQKEKLVQFKEITKAAEKTAKQCLLATDWSLEAAVEHFYRQRDGGGGVDRGAIEALFEEYKEQGSDVMQAEGIGRFCADIGVDPADIVLVVISFYMKAQTMCVYSRTEFVSGMAAMGCVSAADVRARTKALRDEVRDPTRFKELYCYTYKWACEAGQKCLQLDMALGMWKVMFQRPNEWHLLDEWTEFLQKMHGRAVSRDTWEQLLEFRRTIRDDFSNYSDEGAWPYLIDDFVEHMQSRQNGKQ